MKAQLATKYDHLAVEEGKHRNWVEKVISLPVISQSNHFQ